jgi:mRNA interferase HigB
MRLIDAKRLNEFGDKHADADAALQAWGRTAKKAEWKSLADVRKDFPRADGVTVKSGRIVTVFNIRGGNYRLLTAIHYNTGIVYVMRFLTHGEYDKAQWKQQL